MELVRSSSEDAFSGQAARAQLAGWYAKYGNYKPNVSPKSIKDTTTESDHRFNFSSKGGDTINLLCGQPSRGIESERTHSNNLTIDVWAPNALLSRPPSPLIMHRGSECVHN